MGEVYRARDTRLDRLVAIKVIAENAAGGELALERFEREARAASALNHPNICTIYDVGEASLALSSQPSALSPTRYLVMELLEGETLQQRLTRGPLHLAAIIDLGIALADALETAHAAGIIHRDIKPANIFLAARGPKILDFGLAKTAQPAATASAKATLATWATLSPGALQTQPGSTVGTIAYMSPEQLRGEELDARSDLFSLGLVLYEMAVGRPAFAGSTSAVISAAILHKDPVAPRQLRAEIPARLDEVILKALEKDREIRCQTASELRADLKRLKRESGSRAALDPTVAIPALTGLEPVPVPPPAPPPARPASTVTRPPRPAPTVTPPPSSDAELVAAAVVRKFRNGLIGVVAGAVAAVALAFVMADRWYAFRQSPDAPAPTGSSAPVPDPRTSDTLMARGPSAPQPAVRPSSPAQSAAGPAAAAPAPPPTDSASPPATSTPPPPVSVPVGNPNGPTPATDQLTRSGIARRPAISADGSIVAYVQQRGDEFSLWIHRMAGNTDRRIVQAESGAQIVGATVAPDASFVDYVQRKDGRLELWRVPATGASAERVVDRIDSLSAWSADGQQMTFLRVIERPALTAVLVVADRNGRNERVLGARRGNPLLSGLGILTRPGVRPAWSADGRAIAVPGFERRPSGGVLERRGAGANRRGLPLDGGDRGGAPAGRGAQTPQIVFVDVATGRERTVPTGLPVSDVAWLNGHTLVLDRAAEPGFPTELWRLSEPGGQLSRLTTDSNRYSDVSVTADGGSLVTTRYERRGAVIASDVVLMRGLR